MCVLACASCLWNSVGASNNVCVRVLAKLFMRPLAHFFHCNHQLTHSASLPSTKIHLGRNSRSRSRSRVENFTRNETKQVGNDADVGKEFFNKLLFGGDDHHHEDENEEGRGN